MTPHARTQAEALGVTPDAAQKYGSLARATTWKIAAVEQSITQMRDALCPHVDPMKRVEALALSMKTLEIVEK